MDSHLMMMQAKKEQKSLLQTLGNAHEQQLNNWYFTLNSGGLIASLTLLTINNKNYKCLCFVLIIIFTLGLLSIILSCFFQKKSLQNNFFDIKSTSFFFKDSTIDLFQCSSIIIFLLGVTIGLIELFRSI